MVAVLVTLLQQHRELLEGILQHQGIRIFPHSPSELWALLLVLLKVLLLLPIVQTGDYVHALPQHLQWRLVLLLLVLQCYTHWHDIVCSFHGTDCKCHFFSTSLNQLLQYNIEAVLQQLDILQKPVIIQGSHRDTPPVN